MKKSTVIAVSSVLVACILAASPFVFKKIKAIEADKHLTEKYETYVDSSTVFFDNTFINGVNISGQTPEDATFLVFNDFRNKSVSVESPFEDAPEAYSFSNLYISKEGIEGVVNALFDEQTLTRDEFVNGASRREYSYDFSKDIDFDKSDFSALNIFDEEAHAASADAYVFVDPDTKETSIKKEEYGTQIDRSHFSKKFKNAVAMNEDTVLLDKDDFIKPMVFSTDGSLSDRKKFIDLCLKKTLTFYVCGVELSLSPEDLFGLYDFSSDEYIDEEAVSGYVDGLKKKYDTFGILRPFLTSTGIPVIIQGGDFGWRIDRDATIESLKGALLENTEVSAGNAVYEITGQRPASNEIGNTYVEISLDNQKIWMYLDGNLIAYDDCTTGEATDPNCTSDAGMFRLVYKCQDVVLRGPTWEDFVSFWMNFDGNNGMHDASWRTDEEFGGTNRFGNGSHGCTNLRYNTAAIIYNNIQYDTPIIVW